MNKRKPDDEFAKINLSYVNAQGKEIVVFCPESKDAIATQNPSRHSLANAGETVGLPTNKEPAILGKNKLSPKPSRPTAGEPEVSSTLQKESLEEQLKEQHFTIYYGDTGHSYDSIIGPYLQHAKSLIIEDPYIRASHQIQNFVRFCETVVKSETVKQIQLVSSYDDSTPLAEVQDKLNDLKQSLLEIDIKLDIQLNENLHDREIRIDNGWVIKIGRGLDFYQRPDSWFGIGANDMALRKCLETKIDIFRGSSESNT